MSDTKDKKPHPNGPFKRTGDQALEWENAIGPSLDALPGTQLPLVRTILQRYRALRIDQPYESALNLAKKIADEVEEIWQRARVPTIAHRSVVAKVTSAVDAWKKCHNPGELATKCKNLDDLLDLTPKLRGRVSDEAQLEHLRILMRQNSDMKRMKPGAEMYDWKEDYNFFLDQFKVRPILYINE